MRFSILVIAFTASMTVRAQCFPKGSACQTDSNCCDGIPCNVSMSRLSHCIVRLPRLIVQHLPESPPFGKARRAVISNISPGLISVLLLIHK